MSDYRIGVTIPEGDWKLVRRGLHELVTDRGTVYVSRTQTGWVYGRIIDGERHDVAETNRPIGRNKVLAEQLLTEEGA